MTKTCQKWFPNLEKSRSGGGLGTLGGDLDLLKAVLADFGRARIVENLAQMAQVGPKLEPRWRQDAPSYGQDGHLEATWGAIWSIFGGRGTDLLKNGRSVKTNNTTTFWPHFGVLGVWLEALGEDFGRSRRQVGLSWAILASSWELLGKMLGEI